MSSTPEGRTALSRASDERNGGACRLRPAGAVKLFPSERRVEIDGRVIRLSKGEARLLHVLARSPGKAITRQELLASVWNWFVAGEPSKIWQQTRLVDGRIAGLRRKLRPNNKLIVTVRGVGYRLNCDNAATPNAAGAGSSGLHSGPRGPGERRV